MDFRSLQKMVYETNKANGWHDNEVEKTDSEYLLNINCEVAEAWESQRNKEPEIWTRENGKPEGMWAELGDVIMRIVDYAEEKDIDLEYLIIRKNEYNKSRGYRHGGKRY